MSNEANSQTQNHPYQIGDEAINEAKKITTLVYALQGFGFLLGITFIAAVIVNEVKKGDVQGTWLESHFRWQIRTFWYSLLWLVVGFITALIGIGVAAIIFSYIWVLYRVVKGWLYLEDGKEMYTETS